MADNIERIIGGESLPSEKEKGELIDLRKAPIDASPEVAGWLKTIGRDRTTIPEVLDESGLVMIPAQSPTYTQLSVTKTTFLNGFKKAIDEANRWLSIFLFRVIKKEAGNVKFKEE